MGFKLGYCGRLDKHTSGLLLLTNDSILKESIASNKVRKKYWVLVKEKFAEKDERFEKMFYEGISVKKKKNEKDEKKIFFTEIPSLIYNDGQVSLLELSIDEGRYHIIRRIFSSLNIRVIHLQRHSISNLSVTKNFDENVNFFRNRNFNEISSISTQISSHSDSIRLGEYKYLSQLEIDDLLSSSSTLLVLQEKLDSLCKWATNSRYLFKTPLLDLEDYLQRNFPQQFDLIRSDFKET